MAMSLKDIHQVLRSVRIEGRQIEELEALLIHSDDLASLFQAMKADGIPPTYNSVSYGDGEIRILGVKIIESQYVQKGSIFRIFKADDKLYPSGDIPFDIGVSGTIPMPYSPTTIPASGKINTDFDLIVGESGVINMPDNLRLPTVADEKKKEEKKNKHSETRKIELD